MKRAYVGNGLHQRRTLHRSECRLGFIKLLGRDLQRLQADFVKALCKAQQCCITITTHFGNNAGGQLVNVTATT